MTKKRKIIYIISSILFVAVITVSTMLIFRLINATPSPKKIADTTVTAAKESAENGDYSKAVTLYGEAIEQYHKLGDAKAEKAARIDQYNIELKISQDNSYQDIVVSTGK